MTKTENRKSIRQAQDGQETGSRPSKKAKSPSRVRIDGTSKEKPKAVSKKSSSKNLIKKGDVKKTSKKAKIVVSDTKNTPLGKVSGKTGESVKKAKRITKTRAKTSVKATSMEDLLKKTGYEFDVPEHGKVVEGVVTEVSKRMILVDIGAKTEGMVVDREYEAAYDLVKDIEVGDKLKAIVVSPENDRGQILLSLKRAAASRAWEHYDELMETGAVLVVRGLEVNRGGLIVRANNTRGFIPSSQFGRALSNKMDELISRPIKVKVIEVDKEKNRLIFSERHVSEADALEKKADALKVIKKGDVFEGKVSGVMPFGAFVTVSVPLSQAQGKLTKGKGKSETRSKDARSSVRAGKTSVGEVDGLVHISEISWEKVHDPNNHFREGDKVKVKVISIDEDARKLNLSVKRLKNDPWDSIEKKYKPGSKHKGEVTRVEQFGAFVNFEPGVDGLIHISKITTGEEPSVGSKLDVFVETVDAEHRRMSLSLVHKTTEKLIYK